MTTVNFNFVLLSGEKNKFENNMQLFPARSKADTCYPCVIIMNYILFQSTFILHL
jgi:hypothetical protein